MAGITVTTNTGTAVMAADQVSSASAPATNERIPYTKLDIGAAGSSSPVTTSNPLPVGNKMDLISITPTLDTSAYASGDLLADVTTVTSAALSTGGRAKLMSVLVVDEDDQGVAFNIFVTSSSTSWGTFNLAPTISDATARSIQAIIPIATADYYDLGGVRVAQPAIAQNIGVICETSGSANLYVALVNGSGTPTFTASGLKIILGFEQCD